MVSRRHQPNKSGKNEWREGWGNRGSEPTDRVAPLNLYGLDSVELKIIVGILENMCRLMSVKKSLGTCAVPDLPLWDKIFAPRGRIDARSVIGPLRLSSKGNDLALVWKGRTGSRHASGFLV